MGLQYGPCMNGVKTAVKFSDKLPMMELNRMVMADTSCDQWRNKWLKTRTFQTGKQCGYPPSEIGLYSSMLAETMTVARRLQTHRQ